VASSANVFDPVFDEEVTRYADYEFRARRSRLGYQAGCERLGLSLWEVEPGSQGIFHYHFANEELLAVLRGTPTLRTPAGARELAEGEVAAFPRGPHGAHAIGNHGEEATRIVFVSEMRGPDVVVYPDDGMLGAFEEMSSPERGGMATWTLFEGAIVGRCSRVPSSITTRRNRIPAGLPPPSPEPPTSSILSWRTSRALRDTWVVAPRSASRRGRSASVPACTRCRPATAAAPITGTPRTRSS
jgi:uncharacterized cupin superfamily protein